MRKWAQAWYRIDRHNKILTVVEVVITSAPSFLPIACQPTRLRNHSLILAMSLFVGITSPTTHSTWDQQLAMVMYNLEGGKNLLALLFLKILVKLMHSFFFLQETSSTKGKVIKCVVTPWLCLQTPTNMLCDWLLSCQKCFPPGRLWVSLVPKVNLVKCTCRYNYFYILNIGGDGYMPLEPIA